MIFELRFLIGEKVTAARSQESALKACGVQVRRWTKMNRSKQRGVGNGVTEHWRDGRKRIGYFHIATGFSRLFPHDLTQVVDFPHLAMVRLFWGRPVIVFATEGARMGKRKTRIAQINANS